MAAVSAQTRNARRSAKQLGYWMASALQLPSQFVIAVLGQASPKRAHTSAQRLSSEGCPVPPGISLDAPDGSLEPPEGSDPKGLKGGVAGPAPPLQPKTSSPPHRASLVVARDLIGLPG
jgi:hypothetical protein